MKTSEQINPGRKHDGLGITSFVLGLVSLVFSIISIIFLFTKNGGPVYLQSLFCGIPFAAISLISGIVSLLQRKRNNQPGSWMVISGIVLGTLFFVMALILVFILLFPFFSGAAY